jgi:hypothetical protein
MLHVEQLTCGYGCVSGGKHALCASRRERLPLNSKTVFQACGYVCELSKGSAKVLATSLTKLALLEVTVTTMFAIETFLVLLRPALPGTRFRVFPDFVLADDDEVRTTVCKTKQATSVKEFESVFLKLQAKLWHAVLGSKCATERFFGIRTKKEGGRSVPLCLIEGKPQQIAHYTVGDYGEVVCTLCDAHFDTVSDFCVACVPDHAILPEIPAVQLDKFSKSK